MTMVVPRYIEIEHIGGPFDGETQRFAVDTDGQPPDFYILNMVSAADYSVDPMTGPSAARATQFYELDTVVDERGPRWVYRWKGETVTDIAA